VYLCTVREVYRGKTRIRWRCYLGPKGEYEYVKRVAYPGVPLSGLRVEGSRELERYININILEGLVSEIGLNASPDIRLRVAESLRKASETRKRSGKAPTLIKKHLKHLDG